MAPSTSLLPLLLVLLLLDQVFAAPKPQCIDWVVIGCVFGVVGLGIGMGMGMGGVGGWFEGWIEMGFVGLLDLGLGYK